MYILEITTGMVVRRYLKGNKLEREMAGNWHWLKFEASIYLFGVFKEGLIKVRMVLTKEGEFLEKA